MTVATRKPYWWQLAMLAVGTLLVPAASVQAQSQKPVLVVSVAGTDSLLQDFAYLTEAAGVGDYGRLAAMVSQPFTQGLDAARPIGVVVTTDGSQFKVLGFVPVKDVKALLNVLPPQVGKPTDVGNGVLQLQGRVPVFIKEHAGWAFIGQTAESLNNNNLPESPAEHLGGLQSKYGIAIRANLAAIPDAYKQFATAAIQGAMQSQLQKRSDENDGQFQLRKKLAENQLRQMNVLLNEVEQLTLGWGADQQSKSTYLDMSITAVEGTKTAKQIAMSGDAKTAFSGFVSPSAAAMMHVATRVPEEDIQETVTMLQSLRERAKAEIQNEADLPNQQARDAAKQLLDGAFDVVSKTMEAGEVDGVAAVTLAPEGLTALAAARVADGNQVETLLKQLADLAKDDPGFPGVQFNADEHAGVHLHTISAPLPEGDDVTKVFGDRLDVAVGTGPTSVFLAIGKDGVAQLKSAIDRSASAPSASLPPFQMRISLGQILQFASAVSGDPNVSSVANAIEPLKGNDNVVIVAKPSGNELTYRFELQEGVLRAIGEAVKAAQMKAARGQ